MDWTEASELKPRLTAGPEIALIDVREHGRYGAGHPFFAVSLPYSRLEIDAPRLLPRKSAPIVLIDDGDGVSELAARRLAAAGYRALSAVRDGVSGWTAAGGSLFDGVNLPSKTLGELIEIVAHTPRIDAKELRRRQESGERFLLLDGRTREEFRKMSIPGATHCPNAELGHRLPELVSDDTTPIVINCAGRTRSIIGAEGLIAQGYRNPIVALENGTQGWELAGLELDHGAETGYPEELSSDTLAASRARAAELMARHRIPRVDLATLRDWQDDDARTLYALDVRTPEEFLAGHLADTQHAPGGQLVQATDKWIAVRGARIVLVDDTGLRAANSAYWLRQMGHDAAVLADDVTGCPDLVEGTAPRSRPDATLPPPSGGAATILDLGPSMAFRKGHIDGARWTIRPRLGSLELPDDGEIVLAGSDPLIAELAAVDLRERGCRHLAYLPGDAESWRADGHTVVASPDEPPDEACIDFVFHTHDRHIGNLDAARAYLAWEVELPDRLDDQERASFRLAYGD